jgi:hypothetical protein
MLAGACAIADDLGLPALHKPLLTELVADHPDCSTHFRTYGGLKAATTQLLAHAATALPKLPARSGSGTVAAPQQRAAQLQAALLSLLLAACQNEASLEEVASDKKLLAALVGLIGSKSEATQAGAVRLLYTVATSPGSGRLVGAALAAERGRGLATMLQMLATASSSIQVWSQGVLV